MRPNRKTRGLRRMNVGSDNSFPGPLRNSSVPVVDLTSVPSENIAEISKDCMNDSILIISENSEANVKAASRNPKRKSHDDSIVIISEHGEEPNEKAVSKNTKRKTDDDGIEIMFEKYFSNGSEKSTSSDSDQSPRRKKRKKSFEDGPTVDASCAATSTVCGRMPPVANDIPCTVTSTTNEVIFIDSTPGTAPSTADVVVLESSDETENSDNQKSKRKRKKRKNIFASCSRSVESTAPVSSSTSAVILDRIGDPSKKGRYQSPLVCLREEPVNNNYSLQSVNGANICNPNSVVKTGLRPVVIDGSNIGFGHGKTCFSVRGLVICIEYFVNRGHQVTAIVPLFRKNQVTQEERTLLDSYEKKGLVVFTPSRYVDGRCISAYDDRFIVQCAAELGGVIVSNDNYRDLVNENEAWKETITQRLLMFTWVGDMLMFPDDPNGRTGPRLDQFLRFP